MVLVTSLSEVVVLQPTSSAAMLANARARATIGSFFMVVVLASRSSVDDEAVLTAVSRRARRTLRTGRAVDPIDAAHQDRGRVGRIREAIVRTRQVLLRDRTRDIRRHDHDQLGLAIDVVAALEQRAEH